ncbi:MAG TPA: aspartyl protease family protein, partial [Nitrososphaera sp.]|nr:aspartyl protease family protein [Nitrososphaera sp.]
MSPQLDFSYEFQYRYIGNHFLPALDVTLIGPSGEDDLVAIIDTGAEFSLFDGRRAAAIGLDLTAGRRQIMGGLAGEFIAWIHEVDLEIVGASFHCEVAFSDHHIQRELLGRHTFFTQVRIA